MSLNNSRQDVSEEDAANTWVAQRFLWRLRGRGCAVFILPDCVPRCEQSKWQGQSLSLLRRQLWLFGCVCVCERESMYAYRHAYVCVCIYVCMCACTCMCVRVHAYVYMCLCVCPCQGKKSDDQSGTFKMMLVFIPLLNLRLGPEKSIKQAEFFSKVL